MVWKQKNCKEIGELYGNRRIVWKQENCKEIGEL